MKTELNVLFSFKNKYLYVGQHVETCNCINIYTLYTSYILFNRELKLRTKIMLTIPTLSDFVTGLKRLSLL